MLFEILQHVSRNANGEKLVGEHVQDTGVPKESVPKYLVNRLVHLAKVTQVVSSFVSTQSAVSWSSLLWSAEHCVGAMSTVYTTDCVIVYDISDTQQTLTTAEHV